MNEVTPDEITKLRNASSESEWNSICDAIKKSRGGQYPPDWYRQVIASGLIHERQAAWLKA